MERKVYNVDEVAEILQTTAPRIRKLIHKGYLKAFRIGRVLIRNEDLDEFLAGASGKDYTEGDPVELKGAESQC